MRFGLLACVSLVVAAVTACTASTDTAESPSSAPAPSALSFCDPRAVMDLRGPDGSRVDLGGDWAPAVLDYPTDISNMSLRQTGDCVWIVDSLTFPEAPGDIVAFWEFHGRVASDFRVRGEFSKVTGAFPGDPWTYGPFTFRIEFVDGSAELVEDREPGEPAPGCSGAVGTCPDPIRYVRPGSIESPAPS
jgi:hypothetical protein